MLLLGFVILFASMTSAVDIVMNNPKSEVYNLGDVINVPVTIKSNTEVYGNFEMDLICNGLEQNFHKSPVYLASGQEKKIESSLILTRNLIGNLVGTCKIKAKFGEEYELTKEFRIVDSMEIQLRNPKKQIAPGEEIVIEGNVIKENGKAANGFVDLIVSGGEGNSNTEDLPENMTGNLSEEILEDFSQNQNLVNESFKGTINNGYFSVSYSMPKFTKAGKYLVRIKAYEKDLSGGITNEGSSSFNVEVMQVPTSLEIDFNSREVEPGSNLKVRSILHDQSGEKIKSSSIMTVTDNEDAIVEQKEVSTGEFLEIPIRNNEPPAIWKVTAVSEGITKEAEFEILEKEIVDVKIINSSIVLKNTGNVVYNDTILVKIGNESVNINTTLALGEEKTYELTAPEGEYEIRILANDKEFEETVALTGNVVGVKESSKILGSVSPLIWVFFIFILGAVALIIVRRSNKRDFFGYFKKGARKNKEEIQKEREKLNAEDNKKIIETKNKADMSLSLKGEKQDSTIVCLKLKNLGEEKVAENTRETLQKASEIAENSKAKVYENQNNIFFIFSPLFTKTFQNGKAAIKVSQEIKKIIEEHNKLAKQKIEFGISVNNGDLIAKKDGDALQFMSLGDLMINTKKIASAAEGEILISEKIKNLLMSSIKTEKKESKGIDAYSIKEVKEEKPENKKFISDFIKRLENYDKK